MLVPSWSKAQKEAFRTQHPTKYPIKQAKHNYPKANVKEFADVIFAADYPEYKGLVTIVRRPKGTTTMETVASVPAEQVGEWLSQMHVSADADYYLTKAQFKAAQTWDGGELFALNAIWVDIDAHGETPSFAEAERMRSLLSTAIKKRYKMGNTYIIDILGLTADEQTAIGISAMPTGAKKRGKNQARDERTAAKLKVENRRIMRMHILGNSIASIAKIVGRCYNTIKKRIDEYTEKLEELFSQHEICKLFRQRAKRIVAELKKCATPISFFEDLIYYANMSTLIMNQAIAEGLAYQSEHERKGPRKQDGSCICTHMNAKGWFAK